MKYLKRFTQLFEAVESFYPLNFSRDDVKNRDSYKDLISNGFEDITPPRSDPGTFRFSHAAFGMDYLIHTTGYIRRQSAEINQYYNRRTMVTQSVVPPGIVRSTYIGGQFVDKDSSNASILYGQPISVPKDYDIKFQWLKNLVRKKLAKTAGVPAIPDNNPKIVKDAIIKIAKKSPQAAIKIRKGFPKQWEEIEASNDIEIIKKGMTEFAQTSPKAAIEVMELFPKIWDEIKLIPGMINFAELGKLGF